MVEAAAFMISLDFLLGDADAAAAADDAVLELNCCCMELTARFLKASDVDEVNADGGILIREVFVGAVSCEVADAALMIQQLRPAKRKAADDDRADEEGDDRLPEALGLDLLGTALICIDFDRYKPVMLLCRGFIKKIVFMMLTELRELRTEI